MQALHNNSAIFNLKMFNLKTFQLIDKISAEGAAKIPAIQNLWGETGFNDTV